MSENGAHSKVVITLSDPGCKPLILDSWLERDPAPVNSVPVKLGLETIDSKHSMAAVMIMLLLSKHHGDKPTDEDSSRSLSWGTWRGHGESPEKMPSGKKGGMARLYIAAQRDLARGG